ncbi:MAG: cupin domain-containing protein [Kiloniellales bacterium]|nr:cupin domain-containing protein [Kiloniellales bacterium]
MTQGELDLMAAEFVLGVLGDKEREIANDLTKNDPAFGEAVAAWEMRLGSIGDIAPAADPPGELFSEIESVIDKSDPRGTKTVRADSEGWEALIPGVEKKPLLRNLETGEESFLMRVAPGTRYPEHEHSFIEECVVIEGELTMGRLVLNPGDYHVADVNSVHQEFRSEKGALVFIRMTHAA